VHYFASDSLRGRAAGSPDAAKAREYIIARYKECGLTPFVGADFNVPFELDGEKYVDVVGVIPGTSLKDEYIVLGAHFDHLGVKDGKVYPGADDNASGSAALIEIARELSAGRAELQRSVIIAAFDGEELGLYGSNYLEKLLDTVVGIDKVKLMMSIDMVGWYGHNGYLKMEGVATIKDGRKLVGRHADEYDIKLKAKNFETSIMTATDTDAFARAQVPTLSVSTGLGPHYHKPSDTPDRIDYEGLDRISGCIADFAADVASDPEFAASGKLARKHSDKSPAFEFGLTASIGGSSLYFPSAEFTTKSGMDYCAGLTSLLNLGRAGFQLDVLYEHAGARFPSVDTAFGKPQSFTHESVTVPLYLRLKSLDKKDYAFVGFGGYYSYAFRHSFKEDNPAWGIRPHEAGLAANFGIKVFNLMLSWDFRWQLTDMFNSGEDARLHSGSYFKASWLF